MQIFTGHGEATKIHAEPGMFSFGEHRLRTSPVWAQWEDSRSGSWSGRQTAAGLEPTPPPQFVCVCVCGVKGLSADVIPGIDQRGHEAYEQKLLLWKASHGEAPKRPEVRGREPRKICYICDGI